MSQAIIKPKPVKVTYRSESLGTQMSSYSHMLHPQQHATSVNVDTYTYNLVKKNYLLLKDYARHRSYHRQGGIKFITV